MSISPESRVSPKRRTGRSVIVLSASSDIGSAACRRWLAHGWQVCGTYRTRARAVEELERLGAALAPCDLSIIGSIREACDRLQRLCPAWDALIVCPGTQEPIGCFRDTDFDEWDASIQVNFTSQLRLVHALLPSRRRGGEREPLVLFFAGGGTNNAVVNYSAYTVSKIALIKMCELLDAEIPDTRFAIVGPGWVKGKIHEATLRAGARAGANYQRTLEKLAGNECTPMARVLDCCEWVMDAPRAVVSGRNFAVAHDEWGTPELEQALRSDPDLYKLRRDGNARLVKR